MDALSQDIIRKAASGDIQAFEAIYRHFCGFVYNVAWRTVSSHEDAEEIVQEVFLVIYGKLKNFRFESSFKTWVYRITVNTSIDYLRKHAQKTQKITEAHEQIAAVKVSNEIENKITQEHYEQLTQTMLSQLTPEQRICMILRNIEGLNYQEIADILNININTVRTRLKRAREFLLSMRKEVINEL